ncbi:MAG: MBL fold metallo-hydrolase [Bacteroidetes bacterium]|nr:MBL fold metallo-hydrolase [Bacteroidota bacterium]
MKHDNTQVTQLTFNPFSTNMFVVADAGEAMLVDASAYNRSDVDEVLRLVDELRVEVKRLVLTHAHIDHIFGCRALSQAFGLQWEIGARDLPLLRMGPVQAQLFGVQLDPPDDGVRYLGDGEELTVGSRSFKVRDVPGHSPGSIALVAADAGFVISGDVLFRGSIGRTDLWQADQAQLMRSIESVLLELPDETVVYSGHGPNTTIGFERRTNPFLQGDTPVGR